MTAPLGAGSPLTRSGGLNLYIGMGNSPTNRVDPSGLRYKPLGVEVTGTDEDSLSVCAQDPVAMTEFLSQLDTAYGQGGHFSIKNGYLTLPSNFKVTNKVTQTISDMVTKGPDVPLWISRKPIKGAPGAVRNVGTKGVAKCAPQGVAGHPHIIWTDTMRSLPLAKLRRGYGHELYEAYGEVAKKALWDPYGPNGVIPWEDMHNESIDFENLADPKGPTRPHD